MAKATVTKRTSTRKKKVVEPESTWFNKSVFYGMLVLTLASTVTACSMIAGKAFKAPDIQVVDMSPVNTDVILDNPNVVVTRLPDNSITVGDSDAHMTLHKSFNFQGLIDKHVETHHNYSDTETVFKCHNLNGKIYSCKIILIEDVTKQTIDPDIIIPEIKKEIAEPKSKKKSWNPFD